MKDAKVYDGLSASQQLNLFRNLYYNDGNATEKGIIANAINDILPKYHRQREEIEAFKQQSEWISVEERLPDQGVHVLATDGDFVGEFFINKRGKWERPNVNDYRKYEVFGIGWWMPLPEPPKGE